jgi:N-methylhydantoinase B/oxoprolinase/acetone carboxylase alpha subunit
MASFWQVVLGGDDMQFAAFGTGRDAGAHGLFGGGESPRSRMELTLANGRIVEVPAMANIGGLSAGTVLRKWNTDGGCFGPPSRRGRRLREADLPAGYVPARTPRP